jgi:hypothetical protein
MWTCNPKVDESWTSPFETDRVFRRTRMPVMLPPMETDEEFPSPSDPERRRDAVLER